MEHVFNVTDLTEAINREEADLPFMNENLRDALDAATLIVGLLLNFLLVLVIALQGPLHCTAGLYVLSLVLSNFVLLLFDVLASVLQRQLGVQFSPDRAYVSRINLQVTVDTIITFNLERFVGLCWRGSTYHRSLRQVSTAATAVFVIWCFATISGALELHLYEQYQLVTVVGIYVFFTGMYLVVFFVITLLLNVSIVLRLRGGEVRGHWKDVEMDTYRLLIGMIVVFLVTVVPQRIATMFYFTPSAHCCRSVIMHVVDYFEKFSTVLGPVVWSSTCGKFRKAIKMTGRCRIAKKSGNSIEVELTSEA